MAQQASEKEQQHAIEDEGPPAKLEKDDAATTSQLEDIDMMEELAELEKEFEGFDDAEAEVLVVGKQKRKRKREEETTKEKRRKDVLRERKELAAKVKEDAREKRRAAREEKRQAKEKADAHRAVNNSLRTTSLTLCDVFAQKPQSNNNNSEVPCTPTQTQTTTSQPIDLIASQSSFGGKPTFTDTAESPLNRTPLLMRRHTIAAFEEEDDDDTDCELELIPDEGPELEPIHNEASNSSVGSNEFDEARLRDRHELMRFRQVSSSAIKFDIQPETPTAVLDLLSKSNSNSAANNTNSRSRRSLLRSSSQTASMDDIALLRRQSTVDTTSGSAMYSRAQEDETSAPASFPEMRKASVKSAAQLHTLLAGDASKKRKSK
eukprot:TRINITY_DN38082_c0_g1_i1.p1 TRINITY_DN38082_c0_g1~~TRINITY_DN38082_c0_g1_i1.p1  ORF type:complete len:377 (+),score=111.24 TRINITY_DN38082_c0_g1_i1:72-1202(+)